MIETQHVSVDRMEEVTATAEWLTDVEEEHIKHCARCLEIFGQLVVI